MKLSEAMTGITPSPTYAGFATNDDFILAVDTADSATSPSDYDVVEAGIKTLDGSVDADTSDTAYVRTGKTISKGATQRKFKITGERKIGDAFQDWVMSFGTIFGKGADVEREYVYFNALTGKGEKGTLCFVNSDTETGDNPSHAEFSVDATSTATPTEYTYATVGQ